MWSYHKLNAYTKHMLEFDLKVSLYFLILAIINR